MASMSYCRFENTSIDLRACVNDLEEADSFSDLDHNKYEKDARKVMVKLCEKYLAEYQRLCDYDEEDLSDLCYED